MAQTATIYNFDIDFADDDRGVYESLSLRVARHPSESEEYLVTRVLAYCLEYTGGVAFSKGLCEPDEPAIVVRDLTGAIRSWVEIGTPDAARLHKASKASPRVALASVSSGGALLTGRPTRKWSRRARPCGAILSLQRAAHLHR
jgi:uncharacterized protein YaeQ